MQILGCSGPEAVLQVTSECLTCLLLVLSTGFHQSQGGSVCSGGGLGVVGVAEVSAAAAESVAAVLDLKGRRRHQATVAVALLLVADVSPTTCRENTSNSLDQTGPKNCVTLRVCDTQHDDVSINCCDLLYFMCQTQAVTMMQPASGTRKSGLRWHERFFLLTRVSPCFTRWTSPSALFSHSP